MEDLVAGQENAAVNKGKGKKASGGSNRAGKAAVPLEAADVNTLTSSSHTTASGKTIEEVYQKKTQLEHILLRPDTYVGSVEKHCQMLWVYEQDKMAFRQVNYVPGLYKIFDEILVNAADNKQRDPSMSKLEVIIDPEANLISVLNDGAGIPIKMHNEEKVYVPELIFGHLLTSSNYDDSVKKTTGGRNGYGAKLTNIFSKEFVIETANGCQTYKQVFRNNMSIKGEPVISTPKSPPGNWTKVTFKPDLAKFKMDHLEAEVVALMSKRVLDMAACLGRSVMVTLNSKKRVQVKCFSDYVNLCLESTKKEGDPDPIRIYERINDRWEVCVSQSEGQFQQVSFVNSICTTKGGSHVNAVTEQIVTKLLEFVNKKKEAKQAGIKPFQVKNNLWVFVNALIENPAFDSQTKETLTTQSKSFGSDFKLSDDFHKKVSKSSITEAVLSVVSNKLSKDLKKTDGSKRQRLTGIAKLEDANDAGGRNSEQCTLILTEGDSAKTLAVAGLGVVGRDHYGVFPLRGKLLNVRDASHTQITNNAEISYIKQILGLQQGKQYDSVKTLRYGHLMIMTDQDHDGSHIKGLLINFLHSFWPSLLRTPGFLMEFITPIVKARKGQQCLSFYTIPEYQNWRETVGDKIKSWEVKYYKGLGTSSAKEAAEYFTDLDRHRKSFEWKSDQDGEMIEMAFSKKKVDARKTWLSKFEPGTFLDQEASVINYSDFVNKELILFSLADLVRSIPSVMDGFKPGQRKIMYCALKKPLTKDVKVSELAGHVSEHSAYHHGEASLQSTIVGLAHNFVGSNNINLLEPNGQFGSRLQGGKDAASGRYLHTCMAKVARVIFPKADDCLMDYLDDDGKSIEPRWYAPVLPMVLVNGSEGIGTGWSSSIPNYNPRDIVENLRRMLNGQEMEPMAPWYRRFNGTIERVADKNNGQSFVVTGIITQTSETTLEITELPLRKWTQDCKEFLEGLMEPDAKGPAFIKDYREYHTEERVHFIVQLSEESMAAALAEGLVKKFKLTTNISTSNMHLFDPSGKITRYETPEQIISAFYDVRLDYYNKRKAAQDDQLVFDLEKLGNKARFIRMVVAGEIDLRGKKTAAVEAELQALGFKALDTSKKAKSSPEDEDQQEEEGEAAPNKKKNFDYLIDMPLRSCTAEKIEELLRQRDQKEVELEALRKTEVKTLWLADLDAFMEAYEVLEAQDAEKSKARPKGKKAGSAPKATTKGRKKADDDEHDDYEAPKKKAPAKRAPSKAKAAAVPPPAEESTKAVEAGTSGGAEPSKNNEDGESDEEASMGVSLQQRLAAMTLKTKESSAPKEPEQTAAMSINSDEETEDAPKAATAKKAPGARKPKAAKKPTVIESGDDDDRFAPSDADSASDFEPEKKGKSKAAAPKKAPARPKAAPKAPKAAKAAPAPRKRATTKKAAAEASNSQESVTDDIPTELQDTLEEPPVHKAPVRKVANGKTTASAKATRGVESDDDAMQVAPEEPKRRPARAARTAPKAYVDLSDSDENDGDSDFME